MLKVCRTPGPTALQDTWSHSLDICRIPGPTSRSTFWFRHLRSTQILIYSSRRLRYCDHSCTPWCWLVDFRDYSLCLRLGKVCLDFAQQGKWNVSVFRENGGCIPLKFDCVWLIKVAWPLKHKSLVPSLHRYNPVLLSGVKQ